MPSKLSTYDKVRFLKLLIQKANQKDIEEQFGLKFDELLSACNQYIGYRPEEDRFIVNALGEEFILENINVDPELNDAEKEFAEKVIESEYLSTFLEIVDKLHKGDYHLKLLALFSAYSAVLSELQLHLWNVGTTGKGKSHSLKVIAQTLPASRVEIFTSCTPKSLYYLTKSLGNEALKNKVLFFDEVKASKEAIPLLRTLTDQTGIGARHLTVDVKSAKKVLDLEIPRPQSVWFTSVSALSDSQLTHRFVFCNPDESEYLDFIVWKHQDERIRKGKKLTKSPRAFNVLKYIFKRIVEETKDLRVVIPYEINWQFQCDRRLYPLFLMTLILSTKIHFKNRVRFDNFLVATEEDLLMSKAIWSEIIKITSQKTSKNELALFEHIPDNREDRMSKAELSELTGFSTWQIRHLCDQLVENNLINQEKNANKWFYWKKDLQILRKLAMQDFSISYNKRSIIKFLRELADIPEKLAKEAVAHVKSKSYLRQIAKLLERVSEGSVLEFKNGRLTISCDKNPQVPKKEGNGSIQQKEPNKLASQENASSQVGKKVKERKISDFDIHLAESR